MCARELGKEGDLSSVSFCVTRRGKKGRDCCSSGLAFCGAGNEGGQREWASHVPPAAKYIISWPCVWEEITLENILGVEGGRIFTFGLSLDFLAPAQLHVDESLIMKLYVSRARQHTGAPI